MKGFRSFTVNIYGYVGTLLWADGILSMSTNPKSSSYEGISLTNLLDNYDPSNHE